NSGRHGKPQTKGLIIFAHPATLQHPTHANQRKGRLDRESRRGRKTRPGGAVRLQRIKTPDQYEAQKGFGKIRFGIDKPRAGENQKSRGRERETLRKPALTGYPVSQNGSTPGEKQNHVSHS